MTYGISLRGVVGRNGVGGLGRSFSHLCSMSGMVEGRVGVEFAENLFGRRIVGAVISHSVVTIIVRTKVAVHRVATLSVSEWGRRWASLVVLSLLMPVSCRLQRELVPSEALAVGE